MSFCRDYGDNPACLKEPDPRYTMDYTDVEPAPNGLILWCSHCGPLAHSMETAINEAFATRADFKEEFKAAVDEAYASQEKQ